VRVKKIPQGLPCGGSFLTVNGSGVRATAGSLGVSKDTVISTLRSFEPSLWHVNHAYLENTAGKGPEI